jgi:hypothetical protein
MTDAGSPPLWCSQLRVTSRRIRNWSIAFQCHATGDADRPSRSSLLELTIAPAKYWLISDAHWKPRIMPREITVIALASNISLHQAAALLTNGNDNSFTLISLYTYALSFRISLISLHCDLAGYKRPISRLRHSKLKIYQVSHVYRFTWRITYIDAGTTAESASPWLDFGLALDYGFIYRRDFGSSRMTLFVLNIVTSSQYMTLSWNRHSVIIWWLQ